MDGETVALRDALEFYRNGPSEDQQVTTRVESARVELRQEHDKAIGELQKVTAGLIAQAQSESKNVNWAELKQSDPEEYIRQVERRDETNRNIQGALDAMDAESTKRDTADAAKHDSWVGEQVGVLHRLHPEWKDATHGASAMKDVQHYLTEVGFPREQIEALEDALSINTVWEAAQYRKIQAAKPGIRKRLRNLPRTLRATARAAETAPQVAHEKEHAAKVAAHREQGSVQSAADLFKEQM